MDHGNSLPPPLATSTSGSCEYLPILVKEDRPNEQGRRKMDLAKVEGA